MYVAYNITVTDIFDIHNTVNLSGNCRINTTQELYLPDLVYNTSFLQLSKS